MMDFATLSNEVMRLAREVDAIPVRLGESSGGSGPSGTNIATAFAVVTVEASASSHGSIGITWGSVTGKCKLLTPDGGILQEGGGDADPVEIKSAHRVPLEVDKIIRLSSDKKIVSGSTWPSTKVWGEYVDPEDYWLAHSAAGNDKLLGQSSGAMTFQDIEAWLNTAAGYTAGNDQALQHEASAATQWQDTDEC